MLALLDIRTLILLNALILLPRSVVMMFLWHTQRQDPAARDWAVGTLLVAIGALLAALRGLIPLPASAWLANALIFPGFMLIDAGLVPATMAGRVVAVPAGLAGLAGSGLVLPGPAGLPGAHGDL